MFRQVATIAILLVFHTPLWAAEDDILVADFENDTYGDWKVEGEAFGPGPAKGTLAGQMDVTGFRGDRLVNDAGHQPPDLFFGGHQSVTSHFTTISNQPAADWGSAPFLLAHQRSQASRSRCTAGQGGFLAERSTRRRARGYGSLAPG